MVPSLRFPHQDPVRPPRHTNTRHMPNPSHSSPFYHPHNIGWGVQIILLLVMQSPPFPVTSSLLGPNILLNTLFSNTLSFLSSLRVNDQVSHPYKTTSKILVLCILIFKFLIATWKTKDSAPNDSKHLWRHSHLTRHSPSKWRHWTFHYAVDTLWLNSSTPQQFTQDVTFLHTVSRLIGPVAQSV